MSITITSRDLLPVRRDKQSVLNTIGGISIVPNNGSGSIPSNLYAPIDSPIFTTQITTPAIYGSVDANGDLIIESTSHATKTTSYVLMQQTGGGVGIGMVPSHSRSLELASGLYSGGSIHIETGFNLFLGDTVADAGQRIKLNTYAPTGHVYFDYYDELHIRSGVSSSADRIIFKSSGEVQFLTGGIHIGGTSEAGDNNLLVDGYVKTDEVNGIGSFISGFAGSNYSLKKNGSDYDLTVDNLTVRKSMKIYELEINKISSVNGGIMVSVANGKAYSVTSSPNILEVWRNTGVFTTFEYSGLEITHGIYSGAGVEYGLWGGSTYILPLKSGVTVTFTATMHKIAGAGNPRIVMLFNHATVLDELLAEGVNTLTYTTTVDHDNFILYLTGDGSAYEFSLTNVSITSDEDKIIFDEDESASGAGNLIQFAVDDYIRSQEWTGRGVDYYLGKVLAVHHSAILGNAYIVVDNITGTPWDGCDLVQVGNSSTASRQNMIYITASETNNPYIQMVSGVTDGDFGGHTKVLLGNLESIAGTGIVPVSPGYGLFCDNVFLSGKIVATSGSIGGWTLGANSLASTVGGNALELNSSTGDITCNKLYTYGHLGHYNFSQQSMGGTYTYSPSAADLPNYVCLDTTTESTFNLPSSGLPGSGSTTWIIINHKYGTGLGANKYHIQGNGYYILNGGSQVSSIDVAEGHAVMLVWEPRGGGYWTVIGT